MKHLNLEVIAAQNDFEKQSNNDCLERKIMVKLNKNLWEK